MYLHVNAKLGLAGRLALVKAVEEGMSLKAAAAAFSVSSATAHRWWHRWAEATDEARRTLSCLLDHSSRPRRSPRQLAPQAEQAICACRRETGWGPRLIAGATGFATRRSGRCCGERGCRGRLGKPSSRPTATSGPAPVISCTWTSPVTRASCDPVTESPATAPRPCAVGASGRGSATTTRTPSSTTTRGWPTSSCTKTSEHRRSPASSSGRSPTSPSRGSWPRG